MSSHMCVLTCVYACVCIICMYVFDFHKTCMLVEISGRGGGNSVRSMLSCLFYVFLSIACLWGKFPAAAEASGS